MNLIPARLTLAARADYTACPEVQDFIMEHVEDSYLNVQARLKELADQEAEEEWIGERPRLIADDIGEAWVDRWGILRGCLP